jgi:hypothetical protein
MDEQVQNCVTVPKAPLCIAHIPRKRPNIFLLRSGESTFGLADYN